MSTASRRRRPSPPLTAAPTQVIVGASAATVANDGAATVDIIVQVLNKYGAPVVGKTVTATASGAGVNTFGTIPVTDANGFSVFTFATTGGVAHTISVKADGIPVDATTVVTGVAPAQTADATETTIAVSASSVDAGGAVTVTVQAKQTGGANKTYGGDTVDTPTISGGTTTGTFSAFGDVGDGSYVATFTVTAAGTAVTIHAKINGVDISGGSLPTVTGTTSASFPTPDFLNNASFESGVDGFTTSGLAALSSAYRATGEHAYNSATGLDDPTQYALKGQPGTNPTSDTSVLSAWYVWSRKGFQEQDRVWARWWFWMNTTFDGPGLKFHRPCDNSFNTRLGGLGLEGTAHRNGLTWNAFPDDGGAGPNVRLASLASVCNGAWHSIEVEQWRNNVSINGGNPVVAFWLDGVNITAPSSGGVPTGYTWITSGGVTYFAAPTRASGADGTRKIGGVEMYGTWNPGNTTAGLLIYLDRVSYSSVGRIGP